MKCLSLAINEMADRYVLMPVQTGVTQKIVFGAQQLSYPVMAYSEVCPCEQISVK